MTRKSQRQHEMTSGLKIFRQDLYNFFIGVIFQKFCNLPPQLNCQKVWDQHEIYGLTFSLISLDILITLLQKGSFFFALSTVTWYTRNKKSAVGITRSFTTKMRPSFAVVMVTDFSYFFLFSLQYIESLLTANLQITSS